MKDTVDTAGILNIDKPQDMTSHDVVAILRKALGIKRIGHTGTLDPMATGVLPICIGSATRIMEYLDLDFKTYRCEMKLGIETDTGDIWGETISQSSIDGITEEAVREAFKKYRGTVSQIPPKYSALKVNGRKLYEYARAGEAVEIKARNVYIDRLDIESIDLSAGYITYLVKCSKGTYIRSVCAEVGETLGCGGTMSGLVRTLSGALNIENALDLEILRKTPGEDILKKLLPTDYVLTNLGEGVIAADRIRWFANGGYLRQNEVEIKKEPAYKDKEAHIPVREALKKTYKIYSGEAFLGTAVYSDEDHQFKADKIFYKMRNGL